jgi:hypothetical protein
MSDHESEDGVLKFPTARTLKVEELIKIYDGIISDADEVLEDSQISGPLPKPDMPDGLESYILWGEHHDPLPPEDLTEMPDLIIGKAMSYFQNWANYVSSELTRAECLMVVQDRHWKVLKAALKIYYREEKGKPANAVDDYITTDSRFVEVDAALLRFKVFVKTAKSRYDGLKRTLNSVSREQTRRSDELERTIHDERGGRAPAGAGESPRARTQPFGRR